MSLFRKKPISVENNHSLLKREFGPFTLTLFGLGAIIGAGLFSITGLAASQNAGPAIILSFLIAAFASLLAGLSYCELCSLIPQSGSAYTYAYAAFGEVVAWIIGWDLILEYAVGSATVSISWSAYLESILNEFGIYYPEWFLIFNLPAFLIVSFVSCILIRGITISSQVNSVMVCIKVAVILIFVIFGWNYVKTENLVPFIPPNKGEFGVFGISGVLKASGVIFFAYIGFDALAASALETKKPEKNVPIGMLGSLAISAFLYVIFSYVLLGMVPYQQLDTAAPVAKAVDLTPYYWLNGLIKLAILAGFTSVMLVMLYSQSRIFYQMSKDGLLPPLFSKIHPRFKTPYFSNFVLLLMTALFGALVPLEIVGHMTSIGTLFAFILVSLGVIVLRKTHPDLPRPFKTPLFPYIPICSIIVSSTLVFSLGASNWIRLFVWFLIGIAVYFSYGYRYSKLRK